MNKFEDMKAFIRIVEAGNITKAADQMNIAKSALSKRLATLENTLGVDLLNRTTRSQKLTDNGRIYYQQCKRIIEDVQELESTLQNEHCALSGNIKAALPLSFGLEHLAPVITQFNKHHPDMTFELDFNDRKSDLIKEGFDMAIRIGKLDDSSLMARKLTSIRNFLAASPEYLHQYGTPQSPEDLLKRHVKLQYSNVHSSWHFRDHLNNKKTIQLNTVQTSNNGDYLCKAAAAGLGIVNTPDFIGQSYVKSGKLIPLLTDQFISQVIGVYAVYPPTRHLNRKVRTFIDFLVDHFTPPNSWQLDHLHY